MREGLIAGSSTEQSASQLGLSRQLQPTSKEEILAAGGEQRGSAEARKHACIAWADKVGRGQRVGTRAPWAGEQA